MINEFKEYKDKKGISFRKLAEKTGLSFSTLSALYRKEPESIPYIRLKIYISLKKAGIDLAKGIDWDKVHNLTYKKKQLSTVKLLHKYIQYAIM